MLNFTSHAKRKEVQRAIVKLVNNQCPGLTELQDGPRGESRVNLTLPAWVVPLADRKPVIARAFVCVTKELSTTGLSLVVNRPIGAEEILVGLQLDGEAKYFFAVIRHIDPLGAGFSQLGVELKAVVPADQFSELRVLNF